MQPAVHASNTVSVVQPVPVDEHTAEQISPRVSAVRFSVTSVAVGVAFVVLDAVLNANPIAQSAYAVFTPLARESVNASAGTLLDLAYGFALTAIFLRLWPALPGGTMLLKALSYSVLVWFFRVLMNVAGQWVTSAIPDVTVTYSLAAGLLEMLLLGSLLSLVLGHTVGPPRSGNNVTSTQRSGRTGE
jgi:hypothetical protein